jgi:hypothetical protein
VNDAEAEKEFIDVLEKVQQASSMAIKLINEGKIKPVAIYGASTEDTVIRLDIPSEFALATTGVKEIKFVPYLSKKLTIKFEKI